MSELRCPFCGKFLDAVVKNQNDWIYSCGNPSCEFFDDCDNYEKKHYLATPEFWQELIRTRKALDVARHTIGWINQMIDGHADKQAIKIKCEYALEQITATLENKNGNC